MRLQGVTRFEIYHATWESLYFQKRGLRFGRLTLIFDLKKISQVGLVVKDIEKSMKYYWEELGIGPWNIWTYASPTTRETTYYGKPVEHKFIGAETMVGDLNVELLQHLEGKTLYKEFLDKKGEGVHHVAYVTNEIDDALNRFKKMGIEVIQSGKVKNDSYYYLDTESRYGIIVEFYTDHGFIPPERTYPPRSTST